MIVDGNNLLSVANSFRKEYPLVQLSTPATFYHALAHLQGLVQPEDTICVFDSPLTANPLSKRLDIAPAYLARRRRLQAARGLPLALMAKYSKAGAAAAEACGCICVQAEAHAEADDVISIICHKLQVLILWF